MVTHPKLTFGGASIGSSYLTTESVTELLNALRKQGITYIDSAARYPPTDPGKSELLLGKAKAAEAGFIIDTKINFAGDGSGTLTTAAIADSLKDSLNRLQVKKVNFLYCHGPDPKTPLTEQAAALNDQYQKGIISAYGVSNFSTPMLEKFIQICKDNNYKLPSIYQGQYNIICRQIETTLFPVLRANGMIFAAYSPLAGGFLSGKLTAGFTDGTRFVEGNIMSDHFKALYDKPSMHTSIRNLENVIKPLGISSIEASLRWICYHSALGEADSVILGASRVGQIEQNVKNVAKGPLPQNVVDTIDGIWKTAEEDSS